ncbi:MAG: hypothetical protein QY321_01065 [Patescibacteria group bacterium]|nr:MAG: hypothetical protein QY321_01065 [Patescibacteria group bacterium]
MSNSSESLKLFILDAQRRLISALQGCESEEYIEALSAWAQGKCRCGEKLVIENIVKSEDTTSYEFVCGHKFITKSLSDTFVLSDSLRVGSLGEDEEGNQKISARQSGKITRKQVSEINVAKKFASSERKYLVTFVNDIENSLVDVIATAEDGSRGEYYQITKLYDKDFWQKLNTLGAVDLITNALVPLIETAIRRKNDYDPKEKNNLILLIDAWPGILNKYASAAKTNLSFLLREANFKEVWLIGQTTFRLWPT